MGIARILTGRGTRLMVTRSLRDGYLVSAYTGECIKWYDIPGIIHYARWLREFLRAEAFETMLDGGK